MAVGIERHSTIKNMQAVLAHTETLKYNTNYGTISSQRSCCLNNVLQCVTSIRHGKTLQGIGCILSINITQMSGFLQHQTVLNYQLPQLKFTSNTNKTYKIDIQKYSVQLQPKKAHEMVFRSQRSRSYSQV